MPRRDVSEKRRRPTPLHYGTGESPDKIAHYAIEAERRDFENETLRKRIAGLARELSELSATNLNLVVLLDEQNSLLAAHRATEAMLLSRCEREEARPDQYTIDYLRARLEESEKSMMAMARSLGETIDARDKTIAELRQENENLGRQHAYMAQKMRDMNVDGEEYLSPRYDIKNGIYREEA
jgi:cell division protein FtsB